MITAFAVEGLPEITRGADLAALIVTHLQGARADLAQDQRDAADKADKAGALVAGDLLVVAHKALSKAEGRVRALTDVQPGARACKLAAALGKDPRHVQVVLDESAEVLRAQRGVLIVQTHHGYVCANAGVDFSNVPGEGVVAMLPCDPDRSARALRARLRELTGVAPGVIVTDSFGRAWRIGQCDFAIGCAGIAPLDDWRGRVDAHGRELHATMLAIADELAACADLARQKDGQQPVVVVRGAERHLTDADGPGAAALIRARELDLFR